MEIQVERGVYIWLETQIYEGFSCGLFLAESKLIFESFSTECMTCYIGGIVEYRDGCNCIIILSNDRNAERLYFICHEFNLGVESISWLTLA